MSSITDRKIKLNAMAYCVIMQQHEIVKNIMRRDGPDFDAGIELMDILTIQKEIAQKLRD